MGGPRRSAGAFEAVHALAATGLSQAAISRASGISRTTIREWLRSRPQYLRLDAMPVDANGARCPLMVADLGPAYAYLLGLYLGDGCISLGRNGVYALRVFLDERYPLIIDGCRDAQLSIVRRAAVVSRKGCVSVQGTSKHWPCLFPQHGAGMKHLRPIVLADWQQTIADRYPHQLLRGLIHSDGCRIMNRVARGAYPRYHFSNLSADIHEIFRRSCDQIGVVWTSPRAEDTSVARRESVAILDEFIGSKLTGPIPARVISPHDPIDWTTAPRDSRRVGPGRPALDPARIRTSRATPLSPRGWSLQAQLAFPFRLQTLG